VTGSIVLLSSGLDSAVAFKMALDALGVDLALTFDYGQRAADMEIESARMICERFGVRHEVLEVPWMEDVTLDGAREPRRAGPDAIGGGAGRGKGPGA